MHSGVSDDQLKYNVSVMITLIIHGNDLHILLIPWRFKLPIEICVFCVLI